MSGLGTFRFREPLLARTERKRQAWHDERHEKDRQEPLSGASERDNLALGRVEGQSAAQVSAVADLQGVMSSFDWYLDRVVHFDRPDTLTVDHDIERATRTSTPIALCVSFRVADIVSVLSMSVDRLLLAALIMKASPPPPSNEKFHILLPVPGCIPGEPKYAMTTGAMG